MPHDARSSERRHKALAFCTWLYGLGLYLYPAGFRHAYGARMVRVFRDNCRAVLQEKGLVALYRLWPHTLFDLAISACLERWQSWQEGFRSMSRTQSIPTRLWIALAATITAFVVALIASLNLYLLEDGNALTQAAYSASALLRFSYDGVYLSALAAGVAMCAIIGYSLTQRTGLVIGGLLLVGLLVAFGGFGGLLVRHTLTFLVFCAILLGLTALSLLCGRALATRIARSQSPRSITLLGSCISVGVLLLINVGALTLHTLLLNPVSHDLYMQGQIAGTHFNFTLIVMGIAAFCLLACLISQGFALRGPSRSDPA